jgi:hypothetical protein
VKTFDAIPQFIKMLKNLDNWLATAVAHAQKKSFDAEVLLTSRLAPDQYPLLRQVQVTCDVAKFTAAYLSGQKAPAHPDTEKTMDELRARIATCISYLETITEESFADAASQKISPVWMAGKWIGGEEYLVQLALPNFYFHITTAYAILRHNGVEVGKRDFIGSVPMHD